MNSAPLRETADLRVAEFVRWVERGGLLVAVHPVVCVIESGQIVGWSGLVGASVGWGDGEAGCSLRPWFNSTSRKSFNRRSLGSSLRAHQCCHACKLMATHSMRLAFVPLGHMSTHPFLTQFWHGTVVTICLHVHKLPACRSCHISSSADGTLVISDSGDSRSIWSLTSTAHRPLLEMRRLR